MVNKVFLVGHLGDAPQPHTFTDGGMLATASLATNEHWRDKQTNERVERTDWHRLVFHARLAEVAAQYLRKGSKVFIEGQLRTRKWQAEDGSDRYVTEVHVRAMEMLDRKQDGAAPAAPARTQAEIDKGARAYAAASGGTVPAQPPAAPAPAAEPLQGGRSPRGGAVSDSGAAAGANVGGTVPPAVGSVPFCDQGVEDDDIPF